MSSNERRPASGAGAPLPGAADGETTYGRPAVSSPAVAAARGRIRLAAAVAAAVAMPAWLPRSAQAQTGPWPNRPVRIVVSYQAGNGTDMATRVLAEALTRSMGQSFFVENRPGAGGNIGTAAAARMAPDGYTLFMGTIATLTMNQHLYDNIGYDPEKDFEPIAMTGLLPMAISANPSYPVSDLQGLLAAARAKPDSVNIALPNTTAKIVFALLKKSTGAPLFGVPYNATPQAMNDVIGGQVPLTIDTVTATRAQAQAGKLKPLAVTSARATELLPGVRSVAEQGVDGFEVTAWNALYAPRGVPPAIVAQLAAEVQRILAQPETKQKLLALGFEPSEPLPPQKVGEFVNAERQRWGALIKAANITP